MEKAITLLKPLLEDKAVLKIGHNMKYDWQIIAAHGVHMSPCDDTMLMSYVLDGSAIRIAWTTSPNRFSGIKISNMPRSRAAAKRW